MSQRQFDPSDAGDRPVPVVPSWEPGPLTLGTREQALLREALTRLASPLEAEDVDQWRAGVNRVVRELFQSDQALFLLPGIEGEAFHSNEYDSELLRLYTDYYRDIDEGFRRVEANGLDVFCRRQLFDRDPDTLFDSECYNDFLAPSGMGDSLGMVCRVEDGVAGVWVHNRRSGHPNVGGRGMAIARLLHPVLQVGVGMRRRFQRLRGRLRALLDAIDDAAAVVDSEGKLLHVNRPLRAVLDACRARRELEAAIRAAAAAAAALGTEDALDGGESTGRRLRIESRLYEICATRVERPLGLRPGATMVVVRESIPPPAPRALQGRFGLTPREAEVAILLWHGLSNREIADRLIISPHTARHHTERVLSKLGIHSRDDVRDTILNASDWRP